MKDYKLLRIWEVIYPIGIYFVVTNVVMFVLNLMHTMTNENYMIYQKSLHLLKKFLHLFFLQLKKA